MIDVVFLLIIFFMVGTQFNQSERNVELKLPAVGQLQAMVAAPDQRIISITKEGSLLLDGQQVSPDQLTSQLSFMRARFPDLKVTVRCDGEAQYQYVANAFAAAQRAGVTSVSSAMLSSTPKYR